MTILLTDGFDYDSLAVLAERGWSGRPFDFIGGAVAPPGYPSFGMDVIENNDVSHALPDFSEGVVGFANKNGSQPQLFGGAHICFMTQTVSFYTCSCDRDCLCAIGTTKMITGVGLDPVNRLYMWQQFPNFVACGGHCACTWKHQGDTYEILGYADDVFPFNVWNYIEFKLTDSIEVHINGAVAISAVALPGPIALSGYCGVSWSGYEKISFTADGIGAGQGVDDVYVLDLGGPTNNDYLGDVHIYTLVPDADGHYTEWTPKTGSNHWDMVNETTPDGESTFNWAEHANSRDSYSLLPLPSTVDTVYYVQLNLDVRTNLASLMRGQPLVRQGSTDNYGEIFDFPRTFSYTSWLLDQDPSNTPWTPSAVNAAEFGIRLVDGGGGYGVPGAIEPSFVGVGSLEESSGGSGGGGVNSDSFYWATTEAPMWPPPDLFNSLGGYPTKFCYNQSDLDAALASAIPGDVIICAARFDINSTYEISGVHGSNGNCIQVIFGWFGQYPSWTGGVLTYPGACKFDYTGGGNHPAVYIHDCSYVKFFGGEITSDGTNGSGILLQGPLTGIMWWDFYIHGVGTHAISIRPQTDAGAASSISYLHWMGIAYKWGQDTSRDTSSEAGTDLHALNIDGSDNPGETLSHLQVTLTTPNPGYPTGPKIDCGPTGNFVNIKSSQGTFAMSDINLCLLAYGLNKVSTTRPAGNLLHFEGNAKIHIDAAWLEAHDIQGRVVDGQGIASTTLVEGFARVEHARAYDTNQNATNLAVFETGISSTQPYEDRYHVYYIDAS